ncbi:hypothetical protein O4H52_16470 [Sphingomonadaceae bacterium G21617-S1]|jgi:hypothetical protein|uniref:hypothetical protein n=1 Tax=Rhizorhabdus sp. TaxID=1968843 RepID=UPI001204E99A|nr:hypothetical protein [Rhizorhabdus sp.]MBD3761292.1 hypothetical protein [Rhizorhabdus sp.]MCZ4343213.1 hypothetical protein [Sphingomonadaceae bacterium G21617-S1]TAK12515.1 MAG: hypothetical protein EPO38_06135 [Rhizorhabdus sp.]
MSADFWEEHGELVQAAIAGKGWGGGRAPAPIMKGSIGQIAEHLRQQDIEQIWRFTIVTDSGRHIRSAELRALVRGGDQPA